MNLLQYSPQVSNISKRTIIAALAIGTFIVLLISPLDYQTLKIDGKPIRIQKQQPNSTGITVVAAYFKTSDCILQMRPRPERTYFKWASNTFRAVKNPMVIFSDSEAFLYQMRRARENFTTKFVKIERKTLWAFQQQAAIEKLTKNRKLYFPTGTDWNVNLACSDYSMINHAKFDLLEFVATENPFETSYIAWLDIGCFRNSHDCADLSINFKVPLNFKDDHFSAATKRAANLERTTMDQVVFQSFDWLGGPSFLARMDVWPKFSRQYRAFYQCMLRNNLTNTDQAVLIGMYLKHGQELCPNVTIEVPVQTHGTNEKNSRFRGVSGGFVFFCDGKERHTDAIFYLCYKLGFEAKNKHIV